MTPAHPFTRSPRHPVTPSRLLLGTHHYPAPGPAASRQRRAADSLRALPGVRLANVQWAHGAVEAPGIPTLAVLREDSLLATGRAGARKPLVSEVFDALCAAAERAGCRWFAYTNSDVVVLPEAVDRVLGEPREGYAFSRMEVDGETGEELGMVLGGVDLFVLSPTWWRRHRRLFRPYILGEPVWDNVYTALLLRHADALLLNREPYLRHERHATAWSGPFVQYTRLLAALDRPHFSRWAEYHAGLLELRARGAGEDEERALQRRVFGARPARGAALLQAARALKARVRYTALTALGR